jgi:hypothetical protein
VFCGVKMRISGGFAQEATRAIAPKAIDRVSHRVVSPRRRRFYAYGFALVWVVVGFCLYLFQLVKLVGGG